MDAETGLISPGGIGFDINCGMRLVVTQLTYSEVKPRLRELIDALFKRIPAGVGSTGFLSISRTTFQDVITHGARWCVQQGYGWLDDLQHTEDGGCFDGADATKIIEAPCVDCGGRGEVLREETLAVSIPVGVEEGMALRIPGHGMPSPESGGTAGDLHVIVRSKRDARFERHGRDLWRVEAVSVVDAVLGTEVEAPTLEGPTQVSIPPGTQPDTVLRLRGKGLPGFGHDRRGDFYLRVRVQVPEQLSSAERDLYERLRALSQA